MEIYQLNSFREIARSKNLTKAAAKMHISQSALSSQIRLLEEELGLQLFERSARGMNLTESGRILESYASSVITASNELLDKAKELTGKIFGTIKLGINTDGSFLKVSQLSRILNTIHPIVHFVFVSSQTIRTPEMLRQGLIDIGFLFGDNDDDDILCCEVSRFNIRIAIPKEIFPNESELNWSLLATLPWIWSECDCPYYQIVLTEMAPFGLKPNKYVDAMDESVVKELVMDGQGIAILREDDARYVAARSDVYIWEKAVFEIPLQLAKLRKTKNHSILDSVTKEILGLWC